MEIGLHPPSSLLPPDKTGSLSRFADMEPMFLLRGKAGMQEDEVACPACLNAVLKARRDYSYFDTFVRP